jgi:hypothetical protein
LSEGVQDRAHLALVERRRRIDLLFYAAGNHGTAEDRDAIPYGGESVQGRPVDRDHRARPIVLCR